MEDTLRVELSDGQKVEFQRTKDYKLFPIKTNNEVSIELENVQFHSPAFEVLGPGECTLYVLDENERKINLGQVKSVTSEKLEETKWKNKPVSLNNLKDFKEKMDEEIDKKLYGFDMPLVAREYERIYGDKW